jgi:hypothetical protein
VNGWVAAALAGAAIVVGAGAYGVTQLAGSPEASPIAPINIDPQNGRNVAAERRAARQAHRRAERRADRRAERRRRERARRRARSRDRRAEEPPRFAPPPPAAPPPSDDEGFED